MTLSRALALNEMQAILFKVRTGLVELFFYDEHSYAIHASS